jgi:hypothetical protein
MTTNVVGNERDDFSFEDPLSIGCFEQNSPIQELNYKELADIKTKKRS